MGNKVLKPKRKRFRTSTKVAIAIAVPVYLAAFAFCTLAVNVKNDDRIHPNASIDGVDVSRRTRAEALTEIGVRSYDERGQSASVTVVFPDGSELIVSGEEVRVAHDARQLVNAAYARGRGQGFFLDAAAYMHRMYGVYVLDAAGDSYSVSFSLDMESLRALVGAYTGEYNSGMEALRPLVYDDRIVVVKGAGKVSASESEVFDIALRGLYISIAEGEPVKIDYYLPDIGVDTSGLFDLLDSVQTAVKSASYDPQTKSVTEEAVGVTFDVAEAITLLYAAESGKAVTVGLVYTDPEVTREEMERVLFRDMIGECVTSIDGSEFRLNNIVLACAAVDGLVLEPGEEFSFNRTVGKRTHERGYRPAPAFAAGRTVLAIGGGICQVSSSIYSSLKDTDIQITERHPHGMQIAYLPRGRDATVSWGTLDFRFINNTEYPLRIDAQVEGRTLTVQVVGTI